MNLSVLTNNKIIISGLSITIYVDNFLIAREHKKDIAYIKHLPKACFKIKDLGEV